MDLLKELQQNKELLARLSESLGGVYGDPFNEMATIVAVADPKKLGRVKVEFQDGIVSDWAYVAGSNKGVLSSQFIGTSCLVAKANARSEDCFVIALINKNNQFEIAGTPLQVPVLEEQSKATAPPLLGSDPALPGDQGMKCNEGNAGRVYMFETEMYQDLVICARRNNRQEDPQDIWNWKSLTHGKWVEKGVDPGIVEVESLVDYSEKTGLPECSRALEGEMHEFSEDRRFRSTTIICRRDENDKFSWMPIASPPVVFRTTLPECSEKIHGMEAVVDSGRDSQLALCLRYQGEMKWVHHASREPIQFFREEPPPTRQEFLDAKLPMPALALQNASAADTNFAGKSAGAALDTFASGIPLFGPKSPFAQQGALDSNSILGAVGNTVIQGNSGQAASAISSVIASELKRDGRVSDTTSRILNSLGGAGAEILSGVMNGLDPEDVVKSVGKKALSQAISGLSSQSSSAFAAMGVGGALGALDASAAMGLSFVPKDVSKYISPALLGNLGALGSQPSAIGSVLNSGFGLPGGGDLSSVLGSFVPGGSFANSAGLPGQILSQLGGGGFGEVAKIFGQFGNLPGFPTLGGGVPQLATTALQAFGLGSPLVGLLGPAGIGLGLFSSLTGIDPLSTILGGIPGLGGLFGGGGGDCPCTPEICRKVSHGVDSDGVRLLHPCGSVVANSHSSYDPIGNPTENNFNRVAESIAKIHTHVGEELCVANPYDLTSMIASVKRLHDMANMWESAKHADWPELASEFAYTFETIEKAFKQTDNNITAIESVLRKIIDVQARQITELQVGNSSFMSKVFLAFVDTSKAILDVYKFTERLDAVKDGGPAFIAPTEPLKIVFENITKMVILNAKSIAEGNFQIDSWMIPADAEWKAMEPGPWASALELANSGLGVAGAIESGNPASIASAAAGAIGTVNGLLGAPSAALGNIATGLGAAGFVLGAVPPQVPISFGECLTIFDKPRILNDSLASKLNSLVPSSPASAAEALTPTRNLTRPKRTPRVRERSSEEGILGGGTTSPPPSQLTPAPSGLPAPLLVTPEQQQRVRETLDRIRYDQTRPNDCP